MFPSLQLLEKVSKEIMSVPNRRKESKRGIHYGLFLLGYQAGLRISEAISFDLVRKNKQGLYQIEKTKGKKERLVYVPKKVIGELRKNNWKSNSTNRFNFYHFLKKIKRELNVSAETELSPHTLRRAFTTYHAESGMPLPLLQKLLGHSSIRTTALYWRNIHGDDDNDMADILAGKRWLEGKKEPPKSPITENFVPPNSLNMENFPELKSPEPIFITNKPKPTKKPFIKETPLLITKQKPAIRPKPHEQEILTKINDNHSINNQQLTLITNQGEMPTKKEQILLAKIKHLEEQLQKIATERNNLKIGKEQEKQRADNYERQPKTIAKAFSQWQKINYYQQLEKCEALSETKEREIQAQIEQPPPFKGNK